jgi:cytosine/adenosine deaminase-related metal-dependent hydrolase
MSIYLKNACFIDSNTLSFKTGHMKITEGTEGKYEFISSLPEMKQGDECIDCSGKYVTRSFACGHHHVYSALARGMGAPKKNPENFYEVLEYIWWTLDKCLDADSIKASALTTAIACAKNGVTFVIDHHASPFAVENSLDIIAEAFDKVGVSHLLCYEISDRDGLEIAKKGLEETERYMKTRQALVGLHASFTVSDETLQRAVSLARQYNSGIHVHVAEDKYDQKSCEEMYKMRVVERLHKHGALDFSKTILGHCLHVSDHERSLIHDSKAWVVQNMESNQNNKVGFFNSEGLGNRIMLGTDGMHSNMLQSVKAAFFCGQNFDTIGYDSAYQRFRNVHEYAAQNKFEGDGLNNLVILDYDTPTPLTQDNFYGHFLFGFDARQVLHVISNGKLIVKDRNITTVNEAEILDFSKEQAVKLWARMKKI